MNFKQRIKLIKQDLKYILDRFMNGSTAYKLQVITEFSTITLFILKVLNIVSMSWWLVFAPVILFYVGLIGYLIFVFLKAAIEW